MTAFIFLCVCSLLVLISSSIAYRFKFGSFNSGSRVSKLIRVLYMADKTPLVTTAGKRVEVDGGSSMMAVSSLKVYAQHIINKCVLCRRE